MTRKAPRHAEAERNDQALLEAAKKLAVDGAHASVATIATCAGVGIARFPEVFGLSETSARVDPYR
ncbi:hypothetical protein [Nonomuraea sp. NPDC003804]|uniref:hypothetical protein n=1 Tax=Nonomuraea sp. NPDC003804 TaxID=3154547 RepID=UPI00339DD427